MAWHYDPPEKCISSSFSLLCFRSSSLLNTYKSLLFNINCVCYASFYLLILFFLFVGDALVVVLIGQNNPNPKWFACFLT